MKPELAAPAPSFQVGGDPAWRRAETALATVAVAATGFRVFPLAGVSPGLVIGLLLLPVWWPHTARFRGARTLLVLFCASVVAGWILAWAAPAAYQILPTRLRFDTGLMLGLAVGLGVLLWARNVLPPGQLAVTFGLGAIFASGLGGGLWSENPWKYALDAPVAMVLLGAVRGRRWLTVSALAVLAAVSLVWVSRASFMIFVVTLGLVFAARAPARWRRSLSWPRLGLLVAVASVVLVWAGTTAMKSGLLGAGIQHRTEMQIDEAGSLLSGGRQEFYATFALLGYRLAGFGLGVAVDEPTIEVARAGMAANVPPDPHYLRDYMFGSGVELHSVAADLWARCGWVGVVLAAAILIVVIRGLARSFREGGLDPLVACLAVWTLWNLAFSPLYSAGVTLSLGLALILPRVREHGATAPLRRSLPYER